MLLHTGERLKRFLVMAIGNVISIQPIYTVEAVIEFSSLERL